MGVISNELKVILAQLEKSRVTINSKYAVMEMPQIDKMVNSKLSDYIEAIPVLNTYNATATPEDIYIGRTAYAQAEKITGIWSYKLITNATLINIETIYNGDSITPEDVISANVDLSGITETHKDIDENTIFTFNTLSFTKQIGLTEDILLEGYSVLNIHGTKVDTEEDFKKEKIDMQEYARERAGMLPNPEVIVIPFVAEEE